jgi:hypothetical protein
MTSRAHASIRRQLAGGAVAGTIATFAMSTLMLAAQRAGLLGRQPPRILADAVLDGVDGRVGERTRRVGTSIVHLGIGAVAGALHQLARHLAGRPRPAGIWGSFVGALFWAMNYEILAPAFGILPPPAQDRPGRPPVMLASNVIWGAVSAAIGDRISGSPHRGATASLPAARGSSRTDG